jgi:NADH-quinone oxidoreductase subunit G/NADP-reducing hydrogenase subunit HndD
MTAVRPDTADTPFGERSSAGKIFGATGGVMEAALRTAHFMLTGNELGDLTIPPLRGLNGRKEARVQVGSAEVGVAVVSGLVSARKLLDELRNGRKDLHFIEVMACPGGCISGGGQPIDVPPEAVRQRMQALYRIDEGATLRTSHTNSSVLRLYEEFLGEPLGHKSHELLHTHYAPREEVVR